ncbi:MAG: GNAT family N-acetyltransferase [Deltaproteobacteria bacterium]|nr:GNAT family N-acetyltransferase [Deltaproteobacteria bacterium]
MYLVALDHMHRNKPGLRSDGGRRETAAPPVQALRVKTGARGRGDAAPRPPLPPDRSPTGRRPRPTACHEAAAAELDLVRPRHPSPGGSECHARAGRTEDAVRRTLTLIEDGTYFLVDVDGELAACGGWSFRSTLFGSDSRSARDATRLRPGVDPARIRAFFVKPAYARQGLGSRLLAHCEGEALAAGFQAVSLGATEPGRRLYRAFGYIEADPIDFDLGGGLSIPIIPMSKRLSTRED